MSATPWIRFFPSDWLGGTRGLTAAEAGIYINLLAMMYERGGPIEMDMSRLARLCGTTNSVFRKALTTLVGEGKIVETDRGLWNERVSTELSCSREKQEATRQNAKRAAETRWAKNPTKSMADSNGRIASALPKKCQPEPEPYTPQTPHRS